MNKFIWVVLVVLVQGCVSTGGTRIDNIPMYGQPEIVRPDFLKKADEKFIEQAAAGFNGSREEASKAWAEVANDFFKKGNLDYAMRRYNQSWLLNNKNYQPYWGFGQIMVIQGKINEAIEYYEKAKALIDDYYQESALYADLGIAYSRKARGIEGDSGERNQYFSLANKYFEQGFEKDNTHSIILEAWANSLYDEQKYEEAWEKVKKAREQGHSVNPKFLETLSKMMQEPN